MWHGGKHSLRRKSGLEKGAYSKTNLDKQLLRSEFLSCRHTWLRKISCEQRDLKESIEKSALQETKTYWVSVLINIKGNKAMKDQKIHSSPSYTFSIHKTCSYLPFHTYIPSWIRAILQGFNLKAASPFKRNFKKENFQFKIILFWGTICSVKIKSLKIIIYNKL